MRLFLASSYSKMITSHKYEEWEDEVSGNTPVAAQRTWHNGAKP